MKRKKWTEEEEAELIRAYAEMTSSGSLSLLGTREKKFRPIADRINSAHHLRDPAAFPFLWSWRDVSVKVQNMRHQYQNVKHKQSFNGPASDWPNFLLYQQVFGENPPAGPTPNQNQEEEEEERERKREREEWEERRWREEERREEEEMEWRERWMGMQMEHEKRMMQMHLEACQAHAQIVALLVRLLGQFIGPGAGDGDGGVNSQLVHGFQQHGRRDPPSMGGDNGKSDASSAGPYI